MKRLAVFLIFLLPGVAKAQGTFGAGIGPGYGYQAGQSAAFPNAVGYQNGYGAQGYLPSGGSGYGGGGFSSGGGIEVSRGNTIFSGLSLLHDPFEQLDIHLLYQQSVQLATNAAAYADSANQRANNLLTLHAQHAGEVARIKAHAIAAATAMEAAGNVSVKSYSPSAQPSGPAGYGPTGQGGGQVYGSPSPSQAMVPMGNPPSPAPTSVLLDFQSRNGNVPAAQQVVSSKCVQCHNPQDRNGGLDLTNLAGLDERASRSILERVTHADPTRRMPLGDRSGSPGEPLDISEIMALFQLTR